MNRRMFLKTGSSAVAITGLAASGLWFNSRTPTKVFEPWQSAGKSYGDPRLDALAYAILAPNPHNRQPWQVNLTGNNDFDLYCDLERRLPHTDPFDRQITIGLGCFTELFVLAANNLGYQVEVESFPDGESHPRLDKKRIAHFKLSQSTPPIKEPLFEQIFRRRSAKVLFDTNKVISDPTMATLLANITAAGTTNTGVVEKIREISYQGLNIEMKTPSTLRESVDLMRIGRSEIEANPDGISMKGAPIELLNNVGIMTREGMRDPNNSMNAQALTMFKEKFDSSMGYVWITTDSNTRHAQLQAGRDYVRLNLQATALNIGMQPVSQTLQEFPEMDKQYQNIHDLLGVKQPNRIQMLARIGYCSQVEPSPRWPLESVLLHA